MPRLGAKINQGMGWRNWAMASIGLGSAFVLLLLLIQVFFLRHWAGNFIFVGCLSTLIGRVCLRYFLRSS